jgi:caa(3)-type oxidase subunit IV
MSEHTEDGHHGSFEEPAKHYVKIWLILLVLLTVSIVGPMFEIQVLTLITAFGIAGVKAYLVAKEFMHLNVEPRYIGYLFATVLGFLLLFFTAVAPDVMKHEGQNWQNDAAKAEVQRALKAEAAIKAEATKKGAAHH